MSKNFVIVGGSKGIGLGIVQRLAADGQNVTVLSRTDEQLASISGVSHVTVDVTTDEITKRCFLKRLMDWPIAQAVSISVPSAR